MKPFQPHDWLTFPAKVAIPLPEPVRQRVELVLAAPGSVFVTDEETGVVVPYGYGTEFRFALPPGAWSVMATAEGRLLDLKGTFARPAEVVFTNAEKRPMESAEYDQVTLALRRMNKLLQQERQARLDADRKFRALHDAATKPKESPAEIAQGDDPDEDDQAE